MNILFWILWVSEFILIGWWFQSEMKLIYLKPNPYIFISLLYLLATVGIRYGLKLPKISFGMVTIPAIPLAGMLIIIIIARLTGSRWN